MYYTSDVELQVLINGKPAKTYGHNGMTYIEGRVGTEFTLKIKNNNSSRILAVPSIDGLSVLDGKSASSESGGYIIEPYSSYEVKGWRTSLKDVSKFVFSKRGNSLSNQTGQGFSNCGVIGCIIYTEKQEPVKTVYVPYVPYKRPCWPNDIWCDNSTLNDLYKSTNIGTRQLFNSQLGGGTNTSNNTIKPTSLNLNNIPNEFDANMSIGCTLDSAAPQSTLSYDSGTSRGMSKRLSKSISQDETPKFKLGTDYGDSISDKVTETTFKRDYILKTFEIHYTTRHELESIGIDVEKKNNKVTIPSAFNDRKFCKLPERK